MAGYSYYILYYIMLYHIAYIKPSCAACRSLTTRWAESILCRVWVHQQLLLKEPSLVPQPLPPCSAPILDLLAGCRQVVRTGLIRNLTKTVSWALSSIPCTHKIVFLHISHPWSSSLPPTQPQWAWSPTETRLPTGERWTTFHGGSRRTVCHMAKQRSWWWMIT